MLLRVSLIAHEFGATSDSLPTQGGVSSSLVRYSWTQNSRSLRPRVTCPRLRPPLRTISGPDPRRRRLNRCSHRGGSPWRRLSLPPPARRTPGPACPPAHHRSTPRPSLTTVRVSRTPAPRAPDQAPFDVLRARTPTERHAASVMEDHSAARPTPVATPLGLPDAPVAGWDAAVGVRRYSKGTSPGRVGRLLASVKAGEAYVRSSIAEVPYQPAKKELAGGPLLFRV